MHLRRHGNLERTIMATPASSILDALPSEVSRGLFAQGRSVSLDAEQTLFLAGDKGDGCYRVEEGLLKASVGAPNGSERILGILGPGSVIGELSMIDGAPRSASVTALRDSKLYFVSQADFDAIGKSSPEIYRDVMKMLARRLRDTNDALAASSFLSVKGRVARALLNLAEAFGKDVGNGRILIRQKVNQSDMAAIAGIGRENVSRALKDWTEHGMVSRLAGYYCLEKKNALQRRQADRLKARHAFAGKNGQIRVELLCAGTFVQCRVLDNGAAPANVQRGSGLKIVGG